MNPAWTVPDETPARCDCGARSYEPEHDGWEEAKDGWWCHDCWLEAAA